MLPYENHTEHCPESTHSVEGQSKEFDNGAMKRSSVLNLGFLCLHLSGQIYTPSPFLSPSAKTH
jgi:hypothetical protein